MTRAAIALALLATTAATAAPPPGISGFHSAAASYSFLLVETSAKDAMPRISDPRVASALRGMTDTNAVLGSQRYEEADLPELIDVCDRVSTLLSRYSAFGAAELVPPTLNAASKQQALNRLMLDNSHAYQDEMTPLVSFTIACTAREVAPLTALAGKLTAEQQDAFRKSTLARIHANLLSIVGNSIKALGDDKIREANKSRVAEALLANLDSYAATLPPADRKALSDQAQTLGPRAGGTAKSALARVANVMQRQDCSGLCTYLRQ